MNTPLLYEFLETQTGLLIIQFSTRSLLHPLKKFLDGFLRREYF